MVHVSAYTETGPSHLTCNDVEAHGTYAVGLLGDLIGVDPFESPPAAALDNWRPERHRDGQTITGITDRAPDNHALVGARDRSHEISNRRAEKVR